MDHQCSPILFCLLCWCTILNKNTTYSIGFIINISDHVSNQRLYLKVMLRCANIYHNQSVKPCIKNCLNLLISDIAFTDALTYIDHLYLIFQKDWRHFFPWKKKCTKNIAEQKVWLNASRERYQASVLFIAFIDSFAIHIAALYTRYKAVVKHTHKTYYRRVLIQRGHCKGYFSTDVTHVKLKNKFT